MDESSAYEFLGESRLLQIILTVLKCRREFHGLYALDTPAVINTSNNMGVNDSMPLGGIVESRDTPIGCIRAIFIFKLR